MASDGRVTPVALTRSILAAGGAFTSAAAWLEIERFPRMARLAAGLAAMLLLLGSHRSHHGAGRHSERMLDTLLDRLWDGAVLGAIAWATREEFPAASAAAIGALGASFLSSYVRARGASLGYAVEESHVTRGLRYGLISVGLVSDHPLAPLWMAVVVSGLAALVRSSQVLKEERL